MTSRYISSFTEHWLSLPSSLLTPMCIDLVRRVVVQRSQGHSIALKATALLKQVKKSNLITAPIHQVIKPFVLEPCTASKQH